jgi:2,5-diamino-6-(ribosylamino)-4(3H)-pyrimidinone 5'-phosphate reductase
MLSRRPPRPKKPGLPFVFVNLAITADGKINTANRQVESFSSRRDREHMLELRAKADAVMAGARTVDLHPIGMGPGGVGYRRRRIRQGLAEFNLRVVVSGAGTLDLDAEVFRRKFSAIIVLTTRRAGQKRIAALRRQAQDVMICGKSEIDFELALRRLREKWKVKRLLCEGGGQLNDALFRAGLVDELHLTICPKIFGGDAAPTLVDGRGHLKLADASVLELKSSRRCGDELFLVYRVKKR